MKPPPHILGIVNITEDSFSDGGLFLEKEKAIEHALQLMQDGADIIDLGAASSNPDSKPVAPQEEINRLEPVIERLRKENCSISIDTFQVETQRYALQKGVDYLNDIQGFPYPEIYPDLARANCKLILMHSIQRFGKAQRIKSDPQTIIDEILTFFEDRVGALEKAGIEKERLILDPGMGLFLGSDPESSVIALQNIERLKNEFGLPVLISVSRKSFLRKISGREVTQVGPATLAAELYAASGGADYIRTHDVRQLKDALAVLQKLES